MDILLDIINDGDLCALPTFIVILLVVGGKVSTQTQQYLGGRLAVCGFVAYGVYGFLAFHPASAEALLGIGVRALLAAGLVLGLSWIILPLAAFVYAHTLGAGWRRLRAWISSMQEEASQRRASRAQERRRQQEQQEFERQAPQRERAQREMQERQEAEVQAQRRRDMARANCELLFDLLGPEIGKRFTRKMLDAFLEKHLADKHPPEYVEHWAQQLQATLRQHADKVQAAPKFHSLEEIVHWFQEQKQEIEKQPLDDKAKRTLLVKLRAKFQELIDQFLEDLA